MSAMLSIDFGNNYTKVGFRQHENATSHPLTSRDLRLDDHNICVPTLAACTTRNGKETWLYGTQVLSLGRGMSSQVFRNWKPAFFRDPGVTHPEPLPVPVAATVSTTTSERPSPWRSFSNLQLIDLLASGELTQDQTRRVLSVLRGREEGNPHEPSLEPPAGFDGEARRSNRANASTSPPPVDLEIDSKEIGRGYFAWLRDFIEPICTVNGFGSTEAIPVRITLPSFGVQSEKARLLLEEILQETGWRLADVQPVLAEPVANLIGTISEGRNAVWTPDNPNFGKAPHYPTMFEGTFLSRRPSQNNGSPIYWVMIVDLGGYTADFAMVGYDLETLEIATIVGDGEGQLLHDDSTPIGVHDLDRRIREVLNSASREVFDRMMHDIDGQMIERFHQVVYQSLKPYMSRGVKIGQDAEERKRIIACLEHFADEVAGFAERFRDLHQFDQIDELILTGGGCNIPLIRDAIRERLKPYHVKKAYIPCSEMQAPPSDCQRLPGLLIRGATALGGTSVFFDYPN